MQLEDTLPSQAQGEAADRRSRTRGRGSHAPNAMDNFCFDVTLSYRRLEKPRRVIAKQ